MDHVEYFKQLLISIFIVLGNQKVTGYVTVINFSVGLTLMYSLFLVIKKYSL